MAQTKISKEDFYLEEVRKFAHATNKDEKYISIYATPEDCLIAEKSHALKKLKNTFKYKIQMAIKQKPTT